MLTKDDAIEISLNAAMIEYETNNIEIIDVEFDSNDKRWLVAFKVWEWFKCIWRVWEGDNNKTYYAFFKELSEK